MGAADVVPGVSGGTIAFITGIYQSLIDALSSFNSAALKLLLQGQWRALWQHVNGTFLLILFAGIITSVATLAKLIHALLESQETLVWSFFMGLIVASVFHIGQQLDLRRLSSLLGVVIGTVAAYLLSGLTQVNAEISTLYLFVCAMIAICAMILPGISGSFILLLLGAYEYVITAIKDFDVGVIAVFGLGCVTGLMSFTHLLSWLLTHYHRQTLAVLTGFMLGSLNKIWPWKVAAASGGESNVLPATFTAVTGQDALLPATLALFALALILVWALQRTAGDGRN